MRLIDLDGLRPLITQFLPALEEAQNAVTQEEDRDEREKLIQRYRPRWVALRDAMSSYSHGKCWYTESKNPGTDDDVDHFRPKGAVKQAPMHAGYYWLAFYWRNYRLSCHRANRPRRDAQSGEVGGKASSFPLVDEDCRAYGPDDDWRAEYPTFLDPTDPQDPPLLTFLPNGEADLRPEYRSNQIAVKRFEDSRLGLHLNWPRFTEDRMQLYNCIANLVDRGSRQAPSDIASGDGDREGFKETICDLTKMMSPRAEYSAAARAYIETYAHVWWIEKIVLKAMVT